MASYVSSIARATSCCWRSHVHATLLLWGTFVCTTATEKPIKGEVVAVGNGLVLDNGEIRPLDLKVGDKVLFGKYSGTEVKLDGEELLVMKEDDVMAVLEA